MTHAISGFLIVYLIPRIVEEGRAQAGLLNLAAIGGDQLTIRMDFTCEERSSLVFEKDKGIKDGFYIPSKNNGVGYVSNLLCNI
jgi:hypothetical protein